MTRKLGWIYMKGRFVPAFVLVIIGFFHMKFKIVENEGGQYFLTKSSYLLRISGNYKAYVKRVKEKTDDLVHPIQKRLLEKEAEKTVLINRKAELEKKECLVSPKPTSGNEIRALIALQKSKDENIETLAQVEAAISELEKEAECVQEHAKLCMERMLEVAKTKAYSYIEGCQIASRATSFYVRSEDHDEQLFQLLTDNITVA